MDTPVALVCVWDHLQKVEGGILEKTKPTEYRWHGPVKHEERDSQGRMLYRISEMAAKFI